MGHFAWGAMRCFRKLFALPFRFVTQGSLELSNDGRAKDCDVPARDQQRSIDDYQETRCDPGSVGAVASIPRHKPSWINKFFEDVEDYRSQRCPRQPVRHNLGVYASIGLRATR